MNLRGEADKLVNQNGNQIYDIGILPSFILFALVKGSLSGNVLSCGKISACECMFVLLGLFFFSVISSIRKTKQLMTLYFYFPSQHCLHTLTPKELELITSNFLSQPFLLSYQGIVMVPSK